MAHAFKTLHAKAKVPDTHATGNVFKKQTYVEPKVAAHALKGKLAMAKTLDTIVAGNAFKSRRR